MADLTAAEAAHLDRLGGKARGYTVGTRIREAEVSVTNLETDAASAQRFIALPLSTWRQSASNDIPDVTDTPATNDQYGGLLHKGSQPILEFANVDTDSALRLHFAASTAYAIVNQTPLPPDIDVSANVVLHIRAAMAGATDTPVIDADSYFNEGDSKVSDASAAITGTSYAEYTVTVAAADVPTGAQTVTIELTPAAHTTDILYISATWLEYTRSQLSS